MIVLLLLIASAKALHGQGRGSKLHPPLSHQALTALVADVVVPEVNVRDRAVAIERLCQSLAGAKTEAPNAPTSQPPSLAALDADAVAREVNVRDRAVAFDRLCQSLAGKRPRLQMHPPLSHPAWQPSTPMRLYPR